MTVQFVPPREPLVDPRTGLITRTWYLLFQGLFSGFGVSDEEMALITPATSATSSEFLSLIDTLRGEASLAPALPAPIALPDDVSPPSVPLFYSADDVLPIIGALRDEVAILRREIDDLRKGQIL